MKGTARCDGSAGQVGHARVVVRRAGGREGDSTALPRRTNAKRIARAVRTGPWLAPYGSDTWARSSDGTLALHPGLVDWTLVVVRLELGRRQRIDRPSLQQGAQVRCVLEAAGDGPRATRSSFTAHGLRPRRFPCGGSRLPLPK